MFLVAVVISGLTGRVRNQAVTARERELRTAALYALSRELSAAQGTLRVVEIAASHLERAFDSRCRCSRLHTGELGAPLRELGARRSRRPAS